MSSGAPTPPQGGIGLDVWLKLAAPLLLVVLALLVWVEPILPGASWIAEHIGPTAVLRFAVGFAFLYLAMALVELRRLGSLFRQVLEQFKRFTEAQRGGAGGGDRAARRDAIRILITALDSPDVEVRDNAHRHLTRLAGTDLGSDPARWRAWMERDGNNLPSS
ncbi:MAG: hypothetical protein U1F36_07970 [Planctomycetota bacterium]